MPVLLVLVLGACRDAPPDDTAASPPTDGPIFDWTVTMSTIGPVRIGMGAAEAGALLGDQGLATDSLGPECHHVPLEGAPGRVLAMIVNGRIVRIEVKDSLVATERGARVGDSEERIQSLYRGRVTVQPHKYTDGHYLVVPSAATLDRLIFETDGSRVTEYRIGRDPHVSWVEGCS